MTSSPQPQSQSSPSQSQSRPLHNELLQQAKINQINELKNSSIYSKQLIQLLTSIIKVNSISESSELVDKITTIHQLNQTIDKQLNQDISKNFYELMKYKTKLENIIRECHDIVEDINTLQSRSELIDQDLRILENTLKLVKNDICNYVLINIYICI